MTSAAIESNPICKYCGVGRHGVEACPRVAEIEYAEDQHDGYIPAIKRVRFHAPQPVWGVARGAGAISGWGTGPVPMMQSDDEQGLGYRTMSQEHEAMKQALRQIARMMRNNPAGGDPVETARAKLNYLGIGWE